MDKSIGREKTESTAETVSETISETAPGTAPGTSLRNSSENDFGRDADGRGIGSYTSTKYANNRYPERTDSESDCALARRKELGGPGGILWKILSSQYRPTLLKKNEPGDYILWALNHPTEFENTYNGTLKS